MKNTLSILFGLAALLLLLAGGPAHAAEDVALKFKLKPGASGKNCFKCHDAFQAKLAKASIHTPLKKGECTGCHSPHTSSHGNLLAAEPTRICLTCHASVIPEGAKSVHKVVAQGECMKCHDPHAADNKANLLKEGNLLCFECHKALGEGIAKAKFRHSPVEKGCLNCHLPHASGKGPFLLKSEVIPLCVGCHKTDRPIFIKKHMNYPVANARCTGCHDPHGSDNPGILYNTVHKPVSNKMCNQCHEEATSANPLKIKKNGFELCKGCHNGMINDTFGKKRMHWPLLSKKECLTCHNPHAGKQKGLLTEPMGTLCGRCHVDTIKRHDKSLSKHVPVKDGQCTACHDPHGSNSQLLMKKESMMDVCGSCHDWLKHSTHPIGEKVKDPRNKNITVQCLSCHSSHGTEFKKMLPFPTTTELCVQCHDQYKR